MAADPPFARLLKAIDDNDETQAAAVLSAISIFTTNAKWEADKRITQTDIRNCNVNILPFCLPA